MSGMGFQNGGLPLTYDAPWMFPQRGLAWHGKCDVCDMVEPPPGSELCLCESCLQDWWEYWDYVDHGASTSSAQAKLDFLRDARQR